MHHIAEKQLEPLGFGMSCGRMMKQLTDTAVGRDIILALNSLWYWIQVDCRHKPDTNVHHLTSISDLTLHLERIFFTSTRMYHYFTFENCMASNYLLHDLNLIYSVVNCFQNRCLMFWYDTVQWNLLTKIDFWIESDHQKCFIIWRSQIYLWAKITSLKRPLFWCINGGFCFQILLYIGWCVN